MNANKRILNVTRNYHMKFRRALRAIDNCACTWVKYGETVRDLTLAESIAARNAQAKLREPLPDAEIHGILFCAPKGHPTAQQEAYMAYQANKFASESVQ